MATPTVDETTLLVPNHDTPTIEQDVRPSYETQVALYLILASIMFERAAFYALDLNLPDSLNFNETLNWTDDHSSIATYIFNGK